VKIEGGAFGDCGAKDKGDSSREYRYSRSLPRRFRGSSCRIPRRRGFYNNRDSGKARSRGGLSELKSARSHKRGRTYELRIRHK